MTDKPGETGGRCSHPHAVHCGGCGARICLTCEPDGCAACRPGATSGTGGEPPCAKCGELPEMTLSGQYWHVCSAATPPPPHGEPQRREDPYNEENEDE